MEPKSTKSALETIPGPKPLPWIGNILNLAPGAPVESMGQLADKFGPIFKLDMPGQRLIVVSSPELVEEVCDDTRFQKHIHNVLRQIREFAGDGLFTAGSQESIWKDAHRVITPAFNSRAMIGYTSAISEIAGQLVEKWANQRGEKTINVCEDMARFAFDSVALATLGYRFQSFQRAENHPFIRAMAENLHEAWLRARRPVILNRLQFRRNSKFSGNTQLLRKLAEEILSARRLASTGGETPTDLLGNLLAAIGVGARPLGEENVINQIITFLIAGHDTTGSLLAFTLRALVSDPRQLERAEAEVDEVVGREKIEASHFSRLTYLEMAVKESLRLWPPAPTFARRSTVGDTVLGGKYKIHAADVVLVHLPKLQRAPSIWGKDAENFRPERMERAHFTRRHLSAFRPFGTGQRACIGAAFAQRETLLALATILQNFSLRRADPEAPLVIRETPVLRPAEFQIYATPRAQAPGLRRENVPHPAGTERATLSDAIGDGKESAK